MDIRSIYFIDSLKGFAIDPSTIYKSIDGGMSWSGDTSFGGGLLRSIFFSSKDTGFITAGGNLLKTSDGGESWSFIAVDCGFNDVYFIDSYNGYAVGECGSFYKSNDGGQIWETNFGELLPIESAISVQFFDSDTGYVCGSYNGGSITTTMRTFDAGNTWTDTGFPYSQYGYKSKNVFFVNSSIGFGHDGPLYRIFDYGTAWMQMPITFGFVGYTITMINDSIGYEGGSDDTSSSAITRTDDGWNTRIKTACPFGLGNVLTIFCLNQNRCWAGTAHGNILRTDNGGGILGISPANHENMDLSVFPNPSLDDFTIHFHNVFPGNTELILSNSLGEILSRKQLSHVVSDQMVRFDVSNFADGIYFITIKSENEMHVLKAIKQKF